MTDVVNKVLAIFLIACMLLIAPLVLMRKSDRIQNEIKAINAMELFLDTVTDAHQIDKSTYDRLAKTIESCGMTADIQLCTYDITISNGRTYMWKTGIIDSLGSPLQLELGDVIELRIIEQTSTRAHDLWARLFGSTTVLFDETLVKMVK